MCILNKALLASYRDMLRNVLAGVILLALAVMIARVRAVPCALVSVGVRDKLGSWCHCSTSLRCRAHMRARVWCSGPDRTDLEIRPPSLPPSLSLALAPRHASPSQDWLGSTRVSEGGREEQGRVALVLLVSCKAKVLHVSAGSHSAHPMEEL